MGMKNCIKWGYLIILVSLILISLIVFLIPIERSAVFWTAYVFTLIAFAINIVVIKISVYGTNQLKSKFLNIPIIYVSCAYLAVQVVLLFILISAHTIPTWLSFIICFLVFACATILIFASVAAREVITKVEDTVQLKRGYIKNMQVDVELLASTENDKEIKDELNRLAQKIRYSDPMSSEQLSELEYEIENQIKCLWTSDNKQEVINTINILLDERNAKCKIMK